MNIETLPSPATPAAPAAPGTDPVGATEVAAAVALYDAMAAGDLVAAAALLDPEVALHVPGTHALAGVHHGLDEVLAWALATRETSDEGEALEVVDVLRGSTEVVVHCRVTATRGARVLDNSTLHLLRFRAGRIVDVRFHNADDVAVDAFWS